MRASRSHAVQVRQEKDARYGFASFLRGFGKPNPNVSFLIETVLEELISVTTPPDQNQQIDFGEESPDPSVVRNREEKGSCSSCFDHQKEREGD